MQAHEHARIFKNGSLANVIFLLYGGALYLRLLCLVVE